MERVSPHIQTCRYIHTPSSFARQSLLYVQEAGHLKSRDRHISRRSHLESYLFFIVLSGRGTVTIGKNRWEIGPGDHIFLDCQILLGFFRFFSGCSHSGLDQESP